MKLLVPLLVSAALAASAAAQNTPAPTSESLANKPAVAPTPSSGSKPTITIKGGTTTGKTSTAAATDAKATANSTKTSSATSQTPAAKGGADKAGKKDEPPPKIDGMEIARGAKGFLGLKVVDGNFKLSFYDPKKKAVAPDVIRAVLRWTPNYKPGNEIYVLGPGEGKSLTAAKTVRPPYNFKLFISLFVDGAEDPTESFVVDFTQ